MYRALGKQNYMINPKRCLCPFISKEKRSKCKEHMSGTVELNRLNDLSNFIQHLLKQRSDNPAAKIAAARLKTADTYPATLRLRPKSSTLARAPLTGRGLRTTALRRSAPSLTTATRSNRRLSSTPTSTRSGCATRSPSSSKSGDGHDVLDESSA